MAKAELGGIGMVAGSAASPMTDPWFGAVI
jgi:hypothetical protein